MKRKRFSEEQIIGILSEAAAGAAAVEVCGPLPRRPEGVGIGAFAHDRLEEPLGLAVVRGV